MNNNNHGGVRKGAGRKSDVERKKISNIFKRMMKKNFEDIDELFEFWFNNIKARGMEAKDMQLLFKYMYEYQVPDFEDVDDSLGINDNQIQIILPDYKLREKEGADE